MTLKNIVEKAASYAGVTLNVEEESPERALFVSCAKEVLLRVSGEMTDIRKKKSIVLSGGQIAYAQIDGNYKRAIRLTKNGEVVPFVETDSALTSEEDGEYVLTYARYVSPATLTEEIALPPKFSLSVLASGTASEYCYRKGFYKESELYDKRFVKGMEHLLSGVKTIRLKAVNV